MCPISNLRTGVVDDLKNHPIKYFFYSGLLVSVNTDDPKMFNTSLESEYQALIDNCGFSLRDIKNLIVNGVKAAWCSEETKKKLLNELNQKTSD